MKLSFANFESLSCCIVSSLVSSHVTSISGISLICSPAGPRSPIRALKASVRSASSSYLRESVPQVGKRVIQGTYGEESKHVSKLCREPIIAALQIIGIIGYCLN
jgi:hypothetical protein